MHPAPGKHVLLAPKWRRVLALCCILLLVVVLVLMWHQLPSDSMHAAASLCWTLAALGVTIYSSGGALLQPEFGEPQDAKEYLCPLTADRDLHIGDDLILQVCATPDPGAGPIGFSNPYLP